MAEHFAAVLGTGRGRSPVDPGRERNPVDSGRGHRLAWRTTYCALQGQRSLVWESTGDCNGTVHLGFPQSSSVGPVVRRDYMPITRDRLLGFDFDDRCAVAGDVPATPPGEWVVTGFPNAPCHFPVVAERSGGVVAIADILTVSGEGFVMAVDATSLEVLWEFKTLGCRSSPPIVAAIDDVQYVALIAFDAAHRPSSRGRDAECSMERPFLIAFSRS